MAYSTLGQQQSERAIGAGGYDKLTPTSALSSGPAGSGLDISELAKLALANRGRKKLAGIYQQNLEYQKMIQDEAYARSLPKGVTGPAGMVTFDDETEEMMMEFSPEMQDLYQGWLRAEQRAGEELAAYDIDERTTKKIDLWRSANAQQDRRQRQELAAANINQGIGGTPAYWKEKALEDSINQGVMDFTANVAHPLSLAERGLLSGEQLAFGNAAIDAPRMLMQQADLSRAIGQGSHTGVNVPGVSLGSLALADTKAGFWSGLMGGVNQYGGGSSASSSGGGDGVDSKTAGKDFISSILSTVTGGMLV
jgi:hypothetical protein